MKIKSWKIKFKFPLQNWGIETGDLSSGIRNHSYIVKETGLSWNFNFGPSSSLVAQGLNYSCQFNKCIIECPCQICMDKDKRWQVNCRRTRCHDCSYQCTEHVWDCQELSILKKIILLWLPQEEIIIILQFLMLEFLFRAENVLMTS